MEYLVHPSGAFEPNYPLSDDQEAHLSEMLPRVWGRFPSLEMPLYDTFAQLGLLVADDGYDMVDLELPSDVHEQGYPGSEAHAFLSTLYGATGSNLLVEQFFAEGQDLEGVALRRGTYQGRHVYFQEFYLGGALDEVIALRQKLGEVAEAELREVLQAAQVTEVAIEETPAKEHIGRRLLRIVGL